MKGLVVTVSFLVPSLIWGALCPSKSGLMNKHTGIVKHIPCARPSPD